MLYLGFRDILVYGKYHTQSIAIICKAAREHLNRCQDSQNDIGFSLAEADVKDTLSYPGRSGNFPKLGRGTRTDVKVP